MTRSCWAVGALLALATLSTSASAACDDIDNYLNIPSPMTGDMEINLDDIDAIECDPLGDPRDTEEIIVEGGTLTLKSSSNMRFVNVGFTVLSGAGLVFDMPETQLGPNEPGFRDQDGYAMEVEEGASVTFTGNVVAMELTNVGSVFRNDGSVEIKGTAYFEANSNVFRLNTGTVKFRDDATFKENNFLAIDNRDSGFVRFSGAAVFEDNGSNFDGAYGCSVTNLDSTGRVIFRGDASFSNDDCFEGVSLYNGGTMKFYGKAYFNDNESNENGGAVLNNGGSLTFRGATQFNNNYSADFGGALAVQGGDVTFNKAARFTGNTADESGAAFAVLAQYNGGFGTLTFKKTNKVFFTDNVVDTIGDGDGDCTVGEVVDGATVVGFPGDDVCVAATA